MRFPTVLRRARVVCARAVADARARWCDVPALLALGASVVLLAGCSHGPQVAATPPFVRQGQALRIPEGSPLRQRLIVAPVVVRAAPYLLPVPATVEADPAHVANVLPALAGHVTAVKVTIGEQVARGQLLALIDSGGMAQAYAALASARDTLRLTREALARARGVEQAGGAAVKDVEAAQSAYVQAEANDQQARAALEALGGSPEAPRPRPIEVRAPISGSITALSVAPGTFVNDPTASLMTITDIDQVRVVAEVPGDDIGLLKVGQRAEISVPAWPGRVFRGRVQTLGAVLNPDTRRVAVRIAIDNADHALRPNMFATAKLAVAQPPRVFVPASALLMNNDSTTVWVETRPWTFVRHTVTVGYDEGGDVQVLRGLAAGARVIVAGGVLLNDD